MKPLLENLAPGWLPPEWAPQSAVMLTWPHESADWWRWLDAVDRAFADFAREIARRERVLITVRDAAHEARVRAALEAAGAALDRIDFHRAPADDAWVRDHGPITVLREGAPVLLDFRFNGWGQKYDAANDDALTGRLQALGAFGAVPVEPLGFVLEGGSIAGDDTDGHIDTLARFCDARTIAWQSCDDPADEHYPELKAMGDELAALRTADGERYRLVALPLPAAKHDEDGKRLPASYANFLIVNGAVLVPAYDDPADAVAAERLRRCFPEHEIVLLNGLPIVHQYGSLHCVSMQLPVGVIE